MTFAQTLKTIRKNLGLTQTELAGKIGVTQEAVGAYERGLKKPDMERVPIIAKALGITTDELYGLTAKKELPKPKNSRIEKASELFNKLTPNQQRLVISQIESWIQKD